MDFSKAKGKILLKQAGKHAEEILNTEKIIQIPIDKIRKNPDNEKIFNMDGIEGLADTIKEDGFTGAIEVFPLDDGNYEILSGHRRFEAAKIAGLKSIPSIILPVRDKVTVAKKLITSNIHNRELSSMDKARAINYYVENVLKPEHSGQRFNENKELSKIFGLSVSQIKYLKRTLLYVPELQELLEKQRVPMSGLIEASNLDPNEQRELAKNLWTLIKRDEDKELETGNNSRSQTLGQKETKEACEVLLRRKRLAEEEERLKEERKKQAEAKKQKEIEELQNIQKDLPPVESTQRTVTIVEPIVPQERPDLKPIPQYKIPTTERLFTNGYDAFPERIPEELEEEDNDHVLSQCLETIHIIISGGDLQTKEKQKLKEQLNQLIELL